MSNNIKLKGRDYVRELVRIRDKKTCQSCLVKWKDGKRRFDVHHLNGLCGKLSKKYDRVADMDGLITLCHRCHMSKHADVKSYAKCNKGLLKNKTNKLKKLKDAGVSYTNIGLIFGVTGAAVSKHLIKHGC